MSRGAAGGEQGECLPIATLTVMRAEPGRLEPLLADLAWAKERHVVETGPQPLAEPAPEGVTFHHHPLDLGRSFEAARQVAVAAIRSDWILVVDSDERVPSSLVEMLAERLPRWKTGVEGVWIARRNHVFGRPIRYSSAWPDYQLRLLRREAASFSDRLHDAMPSGLSRVERLPAEDRYAIQHYNFESSTQFVDKINTFSSIDAAQARSHPPPSPRRALWLGARDFLARWVRMRGFRDGRHGLHLCVTMAFYRYLIEAKRWERAQTTERRERP